MSLPLFSPDQTTTAAAAANMSESLKKIAPNSPSRQSPSEIETSIANASRASAPTGSRCRPTANRDAGVD